MTAVYVILTTMLILLAISAHEIGHAIAMWKTKVAVHRISLVGFPIHKHKFAIRWKMYLPGAQTPTSVEINLIPLGAFVMPDEEGMNTLSSHDRAFIAGSGPLASFVFALLMFLVTWLGAVYISETRTWESVTFMFFIGTFTYLDGTLATTALLALALILWKQISQYVIPIIGIWLLCASLIPALISDPLHSVGGPASYVALGNIYFSSAATTSIGPWIATWFAGIVSLLIGLTNTLPLSPLDGGQITHAWIERFSPKLASIYEGGTSIAAFALIALAIFTDVRSFF